MLDEFTLIPSFDSGQGSETDIVEREGEPSWLNDYTDNNNWYFSGEVGNEVDFHINTVTIGDNHWRIYVQYGQEWRNWASIRFLAQEIELISEEVNDDNSITARARVKPLFFRSTENPAFNNIGTDVNYEITINGEGVYNRTGGKADDIFDYGERDEMVFNFTIQPESIGRQTQFKMTVTYPRGDYPTREIFIGLGFENPLSATYKPYAIRQSDWESLNQPAGFFKIRIETDWINRDEENNNTIMQANEGQNRIREGGEFKQLPPMD